MDHRQPFLQLHVQQYLFFFSPRHCYNVHYSEYPVLLFKYIWCTLKPLSEQLCRHWNELLRQILVFFLISLVLIVCYHSSSHVFLNCYFVVPLLLFGRCKPILTLIICFVMSYKIIVWWNVYYYVIIHVQPFPKHMFRLIQAWVLKPYFEIVVID